MTSISDQNSRILDQDEIRALIALSLVPGVGPGRIRTLISRFGSAGAVLKAGRPDIECVPGVGPQIGAAIADLHPDEIVDQQFERAERVGARLITVWDEEYPDLLKQIYDPPAFLWLRGDLQESDQQAIAIIGTRRATDYGRRIAHEFATELAGRGFTIVSGMAYGIDAAAHRGAMAAGGRTLAVLGSGVDRIYPAEHLALSNQIMENGALLSEYPLGAAPDAQNFPRRNRIVSGLALGVLVVEAHEKGGALITARLAIEQNREVFAVPGSLYSAAGTGCNRLIQNGHAKLVLTVDDIVTELGMMTGSSTTVKKDYAEIEKQLSEIEALLYRSLDTTPIHIDTLCAQTNIEPSTALVYLLSLEFKGLIRQMAGKQFLRE